MKRRILLAEDHPTTAKVMSEELNLLGYEVTVAKNGLEAVAMASRDLPDLIIMDIRMPKMDGLQAAAAIRRNPITAAIPILAATAKALTGDRETCLASGCTEYISKPFTHKELEAALERLLGDSKE